jgi:hypothetical protein
MLPLRWAWSYFHFGNARWLDTAIMMLLVLHFALFTGGTA